MEGEHHQHKQGAMVMQLKGKLKQDAATIHNYNRHTINQIRTSMGAIVVPDAINTTCVRACKGYMRVLERLV